MFSGKIKIAPVDGKGLGIIAMEDIKQGELLLADEPLIVFSEWSPATVLTSWQSLSKEKKEVYLSLSNCHPGMDKKIYKIKLKLGALFYFFLSHVFCKDVKEIHLFRNEYCGWHCCYQHDSSDKRYFTACCFSKHG